jgi:hypothetical protein
MLNCEFILATTTAPASDAAAVRDMVWVQPELAYGIVVLLATLGILMWLSGSRFHQHLLTVVGLAIGAVLGMELARQYAVSPVLGLVIGMVAGASVGYGLFRVWLGVLTSGVIAVALLIAYWSLLAGPAFSQARSQQGPELQRHGIQLPSAPTSSAVGQHRTPIDIPIASPAMPTLQRAADRPSSGRVISEIEATLPKLSPAAYDSTEQWRRDFWHNIRVLLDQLTTLRASLKTELVLIMLIALVAGMILALAKPYVVNVVYCACFGTLCTVVSVALLISLRGAAQSEWFYGNAWILYATMVAMAAIGTGVQCYLYPPPPAPETEDDDEDEQDEEEDDDEKPAKGGKGGKGKKKK